MTKREAFLDAVSKENVEDFINFTKLHKDPAEPFDLKEVVQELSKAQRETLWDRLACLLRAALAEFPLERWNSGLEEEGDREDDMEVEASADLKHTMAVIEAVMMVVTASVAAIQDGDNYKSLLECANVLNEVLASLPASAVALRQAVHRLCEAWWRKGLLGKEELGRTAFVSCLEKSLMLKKPAAEIQRLWVLHEVLLSVDFTSEDNVEMIDLLLQCFLSVNHIKNDDGQRLMVFLFGCDVTLIQKIHGTIKNQLQFLTKPLINHIAEVYFRAWKKASGPCLEEMESACIQDFMQHAVLLHKSSPVHPRVRQILSYFHARKGRPNLDKMLHRLYQPILWRALSAANSEVRANATLLLSEAFPVHDPGQSSDKMEEAVQKQLDILMALLEDPQPQVRSVAALGVCKILARCWELLPPAVVSDFLKKLVTELASDASSPDVRGAVFKCLTLVLDNALSHPLLESLLPALKNSLHDSSEKVRVAFLDMMLKVKAVRAAKFWNVCSMEHMLSRLATDSRPVCKRIVNLLFTSFFPVNQPEMVWCERCVTLIQMNPRAARKFYQHASLYTAPTNIAKLMLTIRRCLNACIESRDDLNETGSSNKENTSVLEEVLSVKDTASMASLLEVVVILWRSIRKALELNKPALRYTVAKFGDAVPKYFNVFQDDRCTAALLLLASLLPPASIPTFSVGALSRLRRLEAGAGPDQYSQLMDCLCGWGQAAGVLELITDWLTEALPKPADEGSIRRKVRIQEAAEAKPDLGLDYLEYLLSRPSSRDSVLPLRQHLKQLHEALGSWRAVLHSHLSSAGETETPSAETALRAFTLHARLSLHLQHQLPEGRDLASLERVAAWVAESALPFLVQPGERGGAGAEEEEQGGGGAGVTEEQLRLARQVVESFLTVCRDAILVGLAYQELIGQILQLCSLVLLCDKGHLCVPLLLSVLTAVAENYVSQDALGREEQEVDPLSVQAPVVLGVVDNIFQKLMEVLSRQLRKQPEDQLCQSAAPALGVFLQAAASAQGGGASAALSGVIATVFAAVIVESRHGLQRISDAQEVVTPESVEDLPLLSSILMTVVLKSPPVTRAFLTELKSSVDSEAIDCVAGLAAILHILAVINRTGTFGGELRNAALSAQRQLHKYSSVTAEDKGDVKRLLYEYSVNALNEILM